MIRFIDGSILHVMIFYVPLFAGSSLAISSVMLSSRERLVAGTYPSHDRCERSSYSYSLLQRRSFGSEKALEMDR
jgi:hypothetical protein